MNLFSITLFSFGILGLHPNSCVWVVCYKFVNVWLDEELDMALKDRRIASRQMTRLFACVNRPVIHQVQEFFPFLFIFGLCIYRVEEYPVISSHLIISLCCTDMGIFTLGLHVTFWRAMLRRVENDYELFIEQHDNG